MKKNIFYGTPIVLVVCAVLYGAYEFFKMAFVAISYDLHASGHTWWDVSKFGGIGLGIIILVLWFVDAVDYFNKKVKQDFES